MPVLRGHPREREPAKEDSLDLGHDGHYALSYTARTLVQRGEEPGNEKRERDTYLICNNGKTKSDAPKMGIQKNT